MGQLIKKVTIYQHICRTGIFPGLTTLSGVRVCSCVFVRVPLVCRALFVFLLVCVLVLELCVCLFVRCALFFAPGPCAFVPEPVSLCVCHTPPLK